MCVCVCVCVFLKKQQNPNIFAIFNLIYFMFLFSSIFLKFGTVTFMSTQMNER